VILPSPEVAETLRNSHRVSWPVGAVVGTLELLDPAPDQDVGFARVQEERGSRSPLGRTSVHRTGAGAFTAGV